jgi:hypothetical protein
VKEVEMDGGSEITPMIDRYLDDELSTQERRDFEALLSDSPELSEALSERRAAMAALSDWADAMPATEPARRRMSPARTALVAAAAAAALAAVPAYFYLAGRGPDRSGGEEHRLTMRSMEEGVTVNAEGELVTDPFPMKWRTLQDGVQVVRGASGEPDALMVDPFPEEGRK